MSSETLARPVTGTVWFLGQEMEADLEFHMEDSSRKILSDLLELKISQRQLHSAVESLAEGQDQMARSVSRLEVVLA